MQIRAQNLSGECQWTKEVGRQNFNFKKQHKECVRRRAELSLSMIPGKICLFAVLLSSDGSNFEVTTYARYNYNRVFI